MRYLQLVVNWLSAVVNWVNPLYLEKEPAIVSTARHFLESLISTAADERIQFDLDHGIHDNNQTTKEDNSNKQTSKRRSGRSLLPSTTNTTAPVACIQKT